MSARTLVFTCLVLAPGASVAFGQVVQLPTFEYFSVQTSVLAPDRGGTFLGGVGRSSSRSSAYGVPGAGSLPGMGRLFGNRALDQTASASGSSVRVTIIDHEELDRAVLAEAARRRGQVSTVDQRAAQLALRMSPPTSGGSTGEGPLLSVAELRRQNEARRAAETAEATRLFAQGRQAETRGQTGTARIYYQMAQKQADKELQRQIASRLRAIK